MQAMGGDVSLCHHLQALVATRVPPARRVSQVGRHSFHHMIQVLVLCLGDVIDASDGW